MTEPLTRTELGPLPLYRRGKVRDTFDLGDRLLVVATDRLSAFDIVLPTPLPGKGAVLTRLSRCWFEWSRPLVPNHFESMDIDSLPLSNRERAAIRGRSMIVKKARRIDVECVVRGYLAGSAWQEYRRSGTVGGEQVRAGLRQGDELPEPLFTPAIKHDHGHDENISRGELRGRIGAQLASGLEERSVRLYRAAANAARGTGLLLADTKFEFGHVGDELIVIDELLTPDSSRFWDAASYQSGTEPSAFDKQLVRDWLEDSGWNKAPPGPELPAALVHQTMARYREVEERIMRATSEGSLDAET